MSYLFSVCIPTFCRAPDLEITLNSIVRQEGFGPDIEIVVIDNASTDWTPELMRGMVECYPNIVYKRNESNIGMGANIMRAASHGNGRYLKLLNDNKVIRTGVVEEWRSLYSQAHDEIIFHYPSSQNSCKSTVLDSNRFVCEVSYYLTWLAGFSIRRDAFHRLDLTAIDCSTELPLTEAALDILGQAGTARVVYSDWFDELRLPVRGGYNYFKVFNENFPKLLAHAERAGYITRRTRRRVKRELIREHTFPFILDSRDFRDHYRLDKSRGFTYLLRNYYSFWEFYLFPLWAAKEVVRRSRGKSA